MKTRTILFIGLLLLSCSIASSNQGSTGTGNTLAGTIRVFASPDLYNLTSKWAGEYNKLNPKLTINVVRSTDNSLKSTIGKSEGICFMAGDSYATISKQSAWDMVVGRDVIVPVMNLKNPFLEEISRKGITSEELNRLFSSSERQNWGTLLGNGQNTPIHFYMTADPIVKSGMGKFLNNSQVDFIGTRLTSGIEMISAIQQDPDALGFCKLIDIINDKSHGIAANIKIVPLDKNGNGKIDFMENIYTDLQTFTRGVWIGKYPKALSGNIYAIASVKPTDETEVAFLKWVLTDGQVFLNTNGFSDLVNGERQTQLDKLNDAIYLVAPEKDNLAIVKILLLVLFILIVAGVFVDIFVRRIRNRKATIVNGADSFSPVFDENSVSIPKGLYFDKTHTWAFMEKNGSVKIGIDDFLQHITGPLTRIEMKNTGEKIKKGDRLFTIIRKGKQLNIYSPISGTITAQNKTLITNSSILNTASCDEGWIYMIEPTNWLLEIQFLFMAEKYKIWLKDEFSRLKDFIVASINASTPGFAYVAIQDGGSLRDNILADLGPEIWEDFQTQFIDTSR